MWSSGTPPAVTVPCAKTTIGQREALRLGPPETFPFPILVSLSLRSRPS